MGRWRTRYAFGLLVMVLTGCADSCSPTREQTDDVVLVELKGQHHAVVSIWANGELLTPSVTPRGAPPGPTTTSTSLPTPEQVKEFFASPPRAVRVTDDVAHPRAAIRGISHSLAPDAEVRSVRVQPNRIVGRLRLPHGLADPLHIRPGAIGDALRAPGTVWVGICTHWGDRRWSRSDDAFDRAPGCTGWVPAEQAVSVGTLTTEGSRSPLTLPTIWLAFASAALVAVCLFGLATRRRWWHALVALIVALSTVLAAARLLDIRSTTDDLQDVFATRLDGDIHAGAGRLLALALLLLVSSVVAALWLAAPGWRAHRSRPRHPASDPATR